MRFVFGLLLVLSFSVSAKDCKKLATPKVFNQKTAMLAVFCHYDEKQRATLVPLIFHDNWQTKKAQFLLRPTLATTYQEGTKEKAVLVVARSRLENGVDVQNDGYMSVYVFEKMNKQWVFEKGKKEIHYLGSYGSAMDVSFLKLGPKSFGLTVNTGFCGAGYCQSKQMVVPLSLPRTVEVAEFELSAGNSGNSKPGDPIWRYTAFFEIVESNQPEVTDYLIKLNYQGNELVYQYGKPVLVDRNYTHCFQRIKYAYVKVYNSLCDESVSIGHQSKYPKIKIESN